MSEPKRYEAMGPEVIATPTGEFVRYEDYARLKAEVERLKEFITQIPAEARIKVLTDAHKGRWDGCPPSDEYIRQMRVAKEGKQL